ncbi:MAG TPA: oligosaccharyl transferase, archaeosortase A system-associated [Methanocella sp.]|nr:oligosaccharyl transferase, archaeosortase A system-associated [Methanocella sp.]
MAKQSKGKRALKAEQKAARANKAAGAAQDSAARDEPVQRTQEIQAEKPKNNKPVAEPQVLAPPAPASVQDKAIALVKSNFSLYTVAIALLAAFMFYVRTLIYSAVFTNWPGDYVNVSADDGVYHMRLLYNTLQHFPFRILYDPFTHFPYGNTIHFGPLYELIPATFLMIVGLGNPSPHLIDTVAAFYPVVLAALVVIPTYYIGKKLFGKAAGLLSALIVAFLPGALLWRSMLGVTDHHIAEVLFMTCSVACLLYALDAARESKLSLEQIRKRDWGAIKVPLIYAALTGIFIGVYLLNWIGGVILSAALFLYFTVQAVIDHSRGRSLDYILILSAFTFLIPTAMILPYCLSNLTFQSVYYSLTQPVLLLAAFAGICVFYFTSDALKKNKAEKWVFPVTIVGMGAAGALALYLLTPGLFGIVQYGLGMLNPSGGLLTVQEAWPTVIDRNTGAFTLDVLSTNYLLTLWTALLGLIALVYAALRSGRQSTLAFLVWNVVMTVALVAQNRFTYYYGVNVALLTACLATGIFGLMGADALRANFLKKVDSFENFQRFVKKNMGSCITVAVFALFFIFIAIYPATPLSDPRSLGISDKEGILFQTANAGSSGMPYEWYDALLWMKNHTPDPQGSPVSASFDYAKGQYYRPTGNSSGVYDYPPSAYGVMSWWDYGHDIEYVANRIPDANPFQAGIIEQNGTTGASPYFCSTDEARSVRMLDQLDTRYVVIDNQMATGKFYAIQKWIGDTDGWEALKQSSYVFFDGTSAYSNNNQVPVLVDTDKWNSSIMNRLYYDDCDGMSHYRLVYESDGDYYVNMRFVDQSYGAGWWPPSDSGRPPGGNLTRAEDIYGLYSNFVVAGDEGATHYMYGARPPVKWVKVFEKVNGATLTGSAPDGANVTATLTLKTDWGRPFNYTATATAHDGKYSFVVPYPTEPMRGDGYSYGITPQTKYIITYGGTTKNVDVPESAVMGGASIQVT